LPNLLSLSTCCVCLELRPLPSTGVTQLHRYYGPIRHPKMPGLSVTGVRLVVPDHIEGLPVLRALSLCTCCCQYPGAATAFIFAQSRSRISLPRKGVQVDPHIDLFEACSAFTRVAACTLALPPIRGTLYPKASAISLPPQPLRLLLAGAVARWDLHPQESAAFARRTPNAVTGESQNLSLETKAIEGKAAIQVAGSSPTVNCWIVWG
jgi:hypothetical protein